MNKRNIIIIIVSLTVFSVLVWLLYSRESTPNDNTVVTESDANSSESTASEDAAIVKQLTDESTPAQETDRVGLTLVSPQITSANADNNKLNVRAFIPSIIEDGGTCTLKILSGEEVIKTAVASASADATTTICAAFSVDISGIGSGTYHIMIEYLSERNSGSSQPQEVEL